MGFLLLDEIVFVEGLFRSREKSFPTLQIEQILGYSRAFFVFADIYREFEGNSKGFAQLLTNILATHPREEDIQSLKTLMLVAKSCFTLVDHMTDTQIHNAEEFQRQLQSDLADIVGRLAGGKGLSMSALGNILSSFGLPLGGQPGRTPKDYSNEYALKAKGRSWRDVAEYTVENDPETRSEFSNRKFNELSFQEQFNLKNRVRQGVRSYADRTHKPFPPQAESEGSPLDAEESKSGKNPTE